MKSKHVVRTFRFAPSACKLSGSNAEHAPEWRVSPRHVFPVGARHAVPLLLKEGTELPSDFDGIKRIQFKKSVKEVIEEIETELKAAGLIG